MSAAVYIDRDLVLRAIWALDGVRGPDECCGNGNCASMADELAAAIDATGAERPDADPLLTCPVCEDENRRIDCYDDSGCCCSNCFTTFERCRAA